MSLYEGAVKRPILTVLCFIAIAIFGIYSYTKLPIDQLPDIETNTIMVYTYYAGVDAQEIENNVTKVIEGTLNSCKYLKHITSKSADNTSIITLEFEYGHNIDDLTNDVRDKLGMISMQLPDGVSDPILFKFDTSMMPILMLAVTAEQSSSALYKLLDENIANPLARVPGVGTVSITGAPQREIYVYCDPQKLEGYNLTVEAISNIIAVENRNLSGGTIDIGNETYSLRIKGEFDDPMEMENFIIASVGGKNIYLKDVAKVVDTNQEKAQESYTNSQRGASIMIQKQSGANTVEICRKINKMLPDLMKNLPNDIKISTINDGSLDIIMMVNALAETILLALLFVVIIVYLFTGRWRATIVIALTIPISLLVSFIYLAVSGGSLNVISLLCLTIAIGMVVDDAIVVLENTTTYIDRGADPKQAAIHATNEVALSVMASTLTIVAVFFPLTLVNGMAGVLFKQLGWIMCVIIAMSLIISITLTPMLCSKMLRLQRKQTKLHEVIYTPVKKVLDALDDWYSKRISWCTRHRKTVIFVCILIFAGSLFTGKFIKTEFFPSSEGNRISATLTMPMNTSVEHAKQIASELSDKWQQKYADDITIINYSVGAADEDNAFAAMRTNGSNIITFTITLKRLAERTQKLSVLMDKIRADIAMVPEIEKSIVNTGSMGMGSSSSAKFEVYGYDFNESDKVAKEFLAKLKDVPAVGEAYMSRDQYLPKYQVDFDREKLAMNGLNMSTAGSFLRNRIYGAIATYFREDGEEYKVMVKYAPEFRQDMSDIENILLYGSGNSAVRVKDVAQVNEYFAPPTIERKDRQRVNTITCMPSSDAVLSDIVEAGQKILSEMTIPLGVSIIVAGDYEEQQKSFKDMGLLALIILMLVFIVMAAQFESLTMPFIIMFSIPFALSGVMVGLSITHTTLNLMSALGAVMLIGIVVKNGIVLIDYTRLCRERGLSAIQSAIKAARSRLRPVLMTSLTTILGMVPMAMSKGEGASMWVPLGVAAIGGMIFSTLVTLVIVPSLYCVTQGVSIKKARRKHAKQIAMNRYWEENKSKFIYDKTANK